MVSMAGVHAAFWLRNISYKAQASDTDIHAMPKMFSIKNWILLLHYEIQTMKCI